MASGPSNADAAILRDARAAAGALDPALSRLVDEAQLTDTLRERARETLGLAISLIAAADTRASGAELRRRKELARLTDPAAAALASALPERVFRPANPTLQWRSMREVIDAVGVPGTLPFRDRWALRRGLRLGELLRVLPSSKRRVIVNAAPILMHIVRRDLLKRVGGFVKIVETADASSNVQTVAEHFARTGVGTEINLVVEAAVTDEEAAKALEWYEGAVRARAPRIAIKPTALIPLSGSAVATTASADALATKLEGIFKLADQHRDDDDASATEISVDSERSDILDMTRDAVLRAAARYPRVRVKMAMQAYLRDTESRLLEPFLEASAERVRRGGVPLGARLVCGANTEGEELLASQRGWDGTPLLHTWPDTHANYFRLMRRMCDAVLRGEFAVTHASMNVITVAHNLIELARAGVFTSPHKDAVGFAMLHGMIAEGVLPELTRRYGVRCHEYVPLISRERVAELFKYYLRRIEELTGSDLDRGTANYVGVTCAFGPNSDRWRSTQVKHGFLVALKSDDERERKGAYPLQRGIHPNRGAHEPFDLDGASFRITPALNAGAEETRRWIDARCQACAERTTDVGPRIRPRWYDQRDRAVRPLTGPTREGLVIATVEMATQADLDRAFDLAEADPDRWAERPMEERLAILAATDKEVGRSREQLVEALMLDAGKSVPEADAEVDETRDFLRLTVRQWQGLLANDRISVTPWGNGTAIVICPKNFPQAIPAAHIAALLASGHRVIVKPSGGDGEETILSTAELVGCFHRAGVPEHALLLFPCDNTCAASLTSHPKAERIRFTGSATTAEKIHLGNTDVDLLAETGAQNVAIVDSSVDLKEAAYQVVQSVCGFAGQKCSKTRLVVLTEDVDAEEFCKYLNGIATKMLVAPATTPHTDITPLRRTPNPGDQLYEDAMELGSGEHWILTPKRPGEVGVREVDQDFDVSTLNEIFAPVVTVMRISGRVEEAVALANRVRGSLTGSLYSRMQGNIDYAMQQWQTGNLYINRYSTGARADQGFGDGFGRYSHRGTHGVKTGTPEFLLRNANIGRAAGTQVPWQRVDTDSSGLQCLLDAIDVRLAAHADGSADERTAVKRAVEAGRSYLHTVATYFSHRRYAPYSVKGQDDWIESRPVGRILLRIHEADDPAEVLVWIFAAMAAKNQLRVSTTAEAEGRLRALLSTYGTDVTTLEAVTLHVEDDVAMIAALPEVSYVQYLERDRVPDAVFAAAAAQNVHVECRPASGDGLVDLIPQFRQQSICNLYHVAGDVSYEKYRRARLQSLEDAGGLAATHAGVRAPTIPATA